MKIAICASLQGAPEEFSPSTPMDCYRLAGAVYNRIADMYPQVEFDLFNRDDFPGQGDAYIALRNAYMAWGAEIAVHIHQDAGGGVGARGWHIIYYHGESIGLCNELLYAISKLPSPMRYGGIVQRGNVAVLKKPLVSVLVEAGFYTSQEDEAIGIDAWADAIVRGIGNYLQHHWGLTPVEKGEDEMSTYAPERCNDQNGKKVYKFDDALVGNGYLCYYNYYNEDFPEGVKFEVYTSERKPVVKKTVGLQERWSLDLKAAVGKDFAGGFAVIVKADKEAPGRLTVLKG